MPRDPKASGGRSKGFFPDIQAFYTKRFFVPLEMKDHVIIFQFEGIYKNARVFINGNFAGQNTCGYVDFNVRADHLIRYGDWNEIKVTFSTGKDSRWYTGAGIYRNVWMYIAPMLHIELDSIQITTLSCNEKKASLSVSMDIENMTPSPQNVRILIRFIDAAGNICALEEQSLHIQLGQTENLYANIYMKNPRLWDLDHPELYTCHVSLIQENSVIDEANIFTGIRKLDLDPWEGLRINGREVKLYGGCIHHDNGILGSAAFDRAEERKIEKLKAAGYNAIRSAHQPVSKAILNACDKYGIAVIDEFTDMWLQSKSQEDYSINFYNHWENDLEQMIIKDYNHPSVLIYSIGNEIPEAGTPAGAAIARKISAKIHALDHTRYTTIAINNILCCMDQFLQYMTEKFKDHAFEELDKIMGGRGQSGKKAQELPFIIQATRETYEAVDIAGYNYGDTRYETDTALFTNWICIGTETYPKDLHHNWTLCQSMPNVIGDFSWTAWDYLGEAAIGRYEYEIPSGIPFSIAYPYFIAYCGDFDITGRMLPQGYYRSAVIHHNPVPYIAVQDPALYDKHPVPAAWSWSCQSSSWNHKGYEGQPIRVEVYCAADEVELLINGTSIARQSVLQTTRNDDALAFRTVFDTIYTPGQIEARAYVNHKQIGNCILKTASDQVHINMVPDRQTIKNTPFDLCFVDIYLEDDQNLVQEDNDRKIQVTVSGSGVLQALGSGNPVSEESFGSDTYTTYFGHLLAVIRPNASGEIKIHAESDGCIAAETIISVTE